MAPRKKLTPRCTICRHPERIRIESARIAGVSLEALATEFGVSRDAVWRHDKSHVKADYRAALIADVPMAELAKRAAEEGVGLLDHLAIVRRTVLSQLLQASALNDWHAVASLSGRATEVLREIGKLTGELTKIGSITINNNQNVMVVNSPLYAEMQSTIIHALASFPDARVAVIEALQAVEQRHSPQLMIEGQLDDAA